MKKLKIVLSSLIALLFISATLSGQPCKSMNKGDGPKMMKGKGIPGISDEQTKKIEALGISFQKEMLSLKNQMAELKARQKTLSTADKADMKAIYSNIDEISKQQNAIMKRAADHQQQVRSILTDEQRIWFDTKPHGKMGKGKFGNKMRGAQCSNRDCKH